VDQADMGHKQVAFGVFLVHLLLLAIGLLVVGGLVGQYEQSNVMMAEVISGKTQPSAMAKQSVKPMLSPAPKREMLGGSAPPALNESSQAIESGSGQADALMEYSPAASGSNHHPRPPYPMVSRQFGEEGLVLLKACMEQGGAVATVDLMSSSGYKRLDTAALETVKQWKFQGERSLNNSQARCYRVPIKFILEK